MGSKQTFAAIVIKVGYGPLADLVTMGGMQPFAAAAKVLSRFP